MTVAALDAATVPTMDTTRSSGPGPDSDRVTGPESGPDFGPGGHLPDRAARRARKIVLRAPLGLSWVAASLVAGLVLAVAGGLFLARSSAPPMAPWVALGELADLPPESRPAGQDVLLVAAGGRVRAFIAPADVSLCVLSNRLEAPDGRVWALTGRGYAGTTSLAERPTLVVDGVVHLDPTTLVPGAPPSTEARDAACTAD